MTALIDIKLGIKSTKKQPGIQLCSEYCNQNLAHHQYGNNFINLQVFQRSTSTALLTVIQFDKHITSTC